MPTYVYRREDGTTFEVFQRISDDALTVDPETGQQVERVISGGAGLQFKGTGFYLTDYVRKGSGEAASGEGKGESSGSKESSSKSESSAKSEPSSGSASGSGSGSSSASSGE